MLVTPENEFIKNVEGVNYLFQMDQLEKRLKMFFFSTLDLYHLNSSINKI